jgi:4-hydroxybenzoate polyprenyltransferase
MKSLVYVVIGYSLFAFLTSFAREVIKDMEDYKGDVQTGCKTMPIVWGLNASKVFVAVWLIVLIGLLIIAQFYVMRFDWWFSIAYSVLFIITPLIIVLKKLFVAQSSQQFHQLSSIVKWVMLSGILSILFFYFYN